MAKLHSYTKPILKNTKKYRKHYSKSYFWHKINDIKVVREIKKIALMCYYCMVDKKTSKIHKTAIIGALGYFIFPMDLIPDFIPIIGYSDDLSALSALVFGLAHHITDEHKKQAEVKLAEWNNFADR